MGEEGGRFAHSTYDSGPEKPGNSVEEKTPTIGKYGDDGEESEKRRTHHL